MSKTNKEEERYVLTPWGCLWGTLTEYGIDLPPSITPTIGEHMVEDFMDAMTRAGYIVKGDEDES